MVENENKINKENLLCPEAGGVKWKPAVEIFSQVSTWVVVPIIAALIAGKALDKYFNTKPWIFLALTAVAFIVSSFGIVQVISKYMKKISKEETEKKK